MLRILRIRDFAIIDEVSLEFGIGLTVFTGETGAGKSILVDALSLIAGGRASADVVRDGAEEAIVEAVFDELIDPDLLNKITNYGIPLDGSELIIRRIISSSGKSRIYINGNLSTLSILQDIGACLIDLYGQHEHQNLLKKEMHIDYLDTFGRVTDQRDKVRESYLYLLQLKDKLNTLEESLRDKKGKEEFYRYQISEIKEADLKVGEDIELTSERYLLSNSKLLSELSNEAYHNLYDNERSVLSELSKVIDNIAEITRVYPKIQEAAELVRTANVNLREVSNLLRRFKDEIRYDPERLGQIEERLYLIDKLKKKYGQTIEEILSYQSKINKELEEIEYSDQDISLLNGEINRVTAELEKDAGELSRLRKVTSKGLEHKVMHELSLLQMVNTQFVVSLDKGAISKNGFDTAEFLIANLNETPRPLARVASGGELSRIMLAIKCLLPRSDSVQTLIFDEVDSGIGGGAADEVGKRLKYLSLEHQVCCVTHLPQIASMADNHYSVEKIISDNRVVTKIKRLDENERLKEISRMLGSRDTTKTAIKYAEEMIKRGQKALSI